MVSTIVQPALTRDQITLMKGVGILLIVLHNIWHLLTELGENQMMFQADLVFRYLDHLVAAPQEAIVLIVSFWGHFGVELFIFATSYGVAISLRSQPRTYRVFMIQRFAKLYSPFLVCVLFYIALNIAYHDLGYVFGPEFPWQSLAWKLLLVSNFVPGEALPPVGPWWFIPFIFQTYMILPGLIWLHEKYGGRPIIAVAAAGYVLEAFYPLTFPNLNFGPIGHLPLICLGIYLSNMQTVRIPRGLLFGSLAVFVAAQFNFYFWLVGDVAAAILGVMFVSRIMPQAWNGIIGYLGGISLYLFLVNGFVRVPFLKLPLDSWWGDLLTGALALSSSVLVALVLQRADMTAKRLARL